MSDAVELPSPEVPAAAVGEMVVAVLTAPEIPVVMITIQL